jgi:uncharacterized protein YbjQ (UPF0145 family)
MERCGRKHQNMKEDKYFRKRKVTATQRQSALTQQLQQGKHTCSTIALERMERMARAAVKRAMIDVDLNLELVKREQL